MDDLDQNIDTSANEEVATSTDTTETIDTSATDTDNTVDSVSGEVADTKPKQSAEVDSAFADMRRKAEAAEKKATELETKRTRDRDITKKYGAEYGVYSEEDISEKYGASHGIHNVEDLQKAILHQEYAEKGIDPDTINQLIENHPLVQEAKKTKENTVISNQYNSLITELKEDGLGSLVSKPEDIPDAVYQRWDYGNNKGGLSLAECFYLEQRKQIAVKKVEATKQSTLNNLAGKQHLKTEGDGATDANDVSIPSETLQMYMDMGKTKKEAMAHYKKIYG
jgi:hypothetical protein